MTALAEEKVADKISAVPRKSLNLTTKLSYHISNSSDDTIRTFVTYVKKKGSKSTDAQLLKCKEFSDVRGDEALFYNTTTGVDDGAGTTTDLLVKVYNSKGKIGTKSYFLTPGAGLQLPASGNIDTNAQYLDIEVYGGSEGFTVYFLPIKKP